MYHLVAQRTEVHVHMHVSVPNCVSISVYTELPTGNHASGTPGVQRQRSGNEKICMTSCLICPWCNFQWGIYVTLFLPDASSINCAGWIDFFKLVIAQTLPLLPSKTTSYVSQASHYLVLYIVPHVCSSLDIRRAVPVCAVAPWAFQHFPMPTSLTCNCPQLFLVGLIIQLFT